MVKIEKLEEFNEWWFTDKVPAELLKERKRELFKKVIRFMNKRQIVSIVGLRRVGKTTIIYQLIEYLLRKKIDKKSILYFSFDEKVENLDEIIESYVEAHNPDFRKQKVYLFLDEIQKLPDWSNQIKKYYDLYPKIKFVISGSEGLFIALRTKEMLAGRMYEFPLKPLSFREYIEFIGLDKNSLPVSRIKSLFREFIIRGGLPEVMGKGSAEIKMYIKSAVVDKIVFQDIASLVGVKDVELLKIIIEVIATSPGMYLEYQSLAKQLDRDRRTIKSYVALLEQSFLVKTMYNYRKGRLSSLRKTKRVYLTDTSIAAAYKGSVDEQFFGKLVESAVVNSSGSESFWKNSHEVDLIDGGPIEVKYKSKVIEKDVRGVREFMRKFSVRQGLVLTKNDERRMKVPEGIVTLKPVWKFLLGK